MGAIQNMGSSGICIGDQIWVKSTSFLKDEIQWVQDLFDPLTVKDSIDTTLLCFQFHAIPPIRRFSIVFLHDKKRI